MHILDLGVIAAYLAAITWFGARFRSGQKTLRDYFLGGRTAPWWAIALSIVSAETSTLTIVGTPALAFSGNLGFLQIVLGYLVARIAISVLFLPQYFRGEMFTAYELMRRRFGPRIGKLTASIFLVTRALAEGVRVFAISLVIGIILGTGEVASIVLIVVLTLFYTFEGGMTAVIWTDVVQMSLYILGAVLSFWVILGQIDGGWAHVAALAGAAGKFTIFDFRFSPDMAFFSRSYTFWAGLAGGCFLTMASHGTDQLMVQRLLSARGEGQSRAALMGSWLVIAVQFTLFLLIGLLLWVYYQDRHLPAPTKMDQIYPAFIWNHLPTGLAGLLMAAILAALMYEIPERGAEFAGFDDRSGYLARVNARRGSPAGGGSLGHRGMGSRAAGHRHRGGADALGAGSGADHRVHSGRGAAGGLPAGRADAPSAGTRRDGGRGRGPGNDCIGDLAHPDRLHLVCADAGTAATSSIVGPAAALFNTVQRPPGAADTTGFMERE